MERLKQARLLLDDVVLQNVADALKEGVDAICRIKVTWLLRQVKGHCVRSKVEKECQDLIFVHVGVLVKVGPVLVSLGSLPWLVGVEVAIAMADLDIVDLCA